ncbi:MAG: RNA polymerase sigma factor [Phycisphaerales bacterium]
MANSADLTILTSPNLSRMAVAQPSHAHQEQQSSLAHRTFSDATVHERCVAIRAGDRAAFASFYRERFDWMFLVAQQCTRRDESFCLDVVHDAMMRIIERMAVCDSEVQLSCWLRAVIISCALDRLRSEQRRRRREHGHASLRNDAVSPTREDDCQHQQQIAWLQSELVKMDREALHLLDLRMRLGWTLGRIGRLLGISPGAVDGRVNRAVAQLRERSDKEFRDE